MTVYCACVYTHRPIFYYRGNEMMAVRQGWYKAHYWTWTNFWGEFSIGVKRQIKKIEFSDICVYTYTLNFIQYISLGPIKSSLKKQKPCTIV